MADLKISALTASTTPLAGTEVLPIVQSGTTKQVSVANLTAGRQVGFSSYNMGITAFTPTAAGNISDGTDNSTTEKITELLVVANDNTWKTSGASFATYRTWLNTTGATIYVSNGAARYRAANFTPAGNLAFVNSGNGIDFSATAGTGTSELLADYEEGTWTPTITSSGGAITSYTSSGTYTKVGRLVNINVNFTITNNGTGFGAINVTNLPFNVSGANAAIGSAREIAMTGSAGIIYPTSSTNLVVISYNNLYLGGTNYQIVASIFYNV